MTVAVAKRSERDEKTLADAWGTYFDRLKISRERGNYDEIEPWAYQQLKETLAASGLTPEGNEDASS